MCRFYGRNSLRCALLLVQVLAASYQFAGGQQIQQSETPPASFEVASVKPSRPGVGPADLRIRFEHNRFEALNATLLEVLNSINMRVPIRGGEGWVRSERFDIVAKTDALENELTPKMKKKLMLALLKERFQLAFHVENKEVVGVALIKGNHELRLAPPKDGEDTRVLNGEHGAFIFQRMSMAGLANMLTVLWHTPVKDSTGISGQFDFTLDPNKFTSEPAESGLVPQDGYAYRLRAAVVDLGLKLTSAKMTENTLVIDHAERPSEN